MIPSSSASDAYGVDSLTFSAVNLTVVGQDAVRGRCQECPRSSTPAITRTEHTLDFLGFI
jgi:hypothetical protein